MFEELDLVFCPGDHVLKTLHNGLVSAFRLRSFEKSVCPEGQLCFIASLDFVDWNGIEFGIAAKTVYVTTT